MSSEIFGLKCKLNIALLPIFCLSLIPIIPNCKTKNVKEVCKRIAKLNCYYERNFDQKFEMNRYAMLLVVCNGEPLLSSCGNHI